MDGPESALRSLAERLRDDDTLLAAHVSDAPAPPALGMLAAAGPRAEGLEADYSFIVEAIREGYLLHYGEPRLVAGADGDLALLAGDYLYALGLERLAGLGDLAAVRELSDLISLAAQAHAEAPAAVAPLWLGSALAVGAGASEAHRAAKAALRGGEGRAREALAAAAREAAAGAGLAAALSVAADAIDFQPLDPRPLG